jgi:hypothetical protein
MLPKIIVINNSANAKYFDSWCYKMLLDVKIDQSHMIGLQTNGGSQIVAWLLCIIILKMEAPKSNLFSLKKVEIFSQLIIGPMTFSKKN